MRRISMRLRNWIRERLRPSRGAALRTSYVPFLERLESIIINVGVPVTAIINQGTINYIGVATGFPFTSPRRQGDFAGASFLRRPGNRHRLPPLGGVF
jgi:hypothetical protein